MLDTYFESMRITVDGWAHRDPEYVLSWSDVHAPTPTTGPGWESPSA
jgi:hypothetical protein